MGCIYLITNLVNGKQYVGQTIQNAEERYAEHIRLAKNHSKNYHLYNAINKYGIDNFKLEVLANNVLEDNLDDLEMYFIDYYDTYNNGYNNTIGGGGIRGYKHSIETRKKISNGIKANMYKINTPERTNKIIEAQKGKKFTEEHKKHISEACMGKRIGKNNAFYGKKHSNVSKQKMHNNSIRYYVEQLDFDTKEVLNRFNCIEDAAKYCINNKYTMAKLSSVMFRLYYTCKGNQQSAYNFRWRYIKRCNDYPNME